MALALKEALRRGGSASMAGLYYPAPGLVEKLAGLGFDAAFVDCEKRSFTEERIEDIARAGRLAGVATIVRPWCNDPGLISRYLDLGADGISAPGIEDAAAAVRLVDAVRFARPEDHDAKMVIAMIESPDAVARLPELLAVEGIDAWTIGANDLAHRMGLPGRAQSQEVQDVVSRAVEMIVSAGKVSALQVNIKNAALWRARGVRLFNTNLNYLLDLGAAEFQRHIEVNRQGDDP